jgi:hypothetical protein
MSRDFVHWAKRHKCQLQCSLHSDGYLFLQDRLVLSRPAHLSSSSTFAASNFKKQADFLSWDGGELLVPSGGARMVTAPSARAEGCVESSKDGPEVFPAFSEALPDGLMGLHQCPSACHGWLSQPI